MENNTTEHKCNGRCEMCNVNQRTYCASQMSYYAQQEIGEIKAILNQMISKQDDENIVLINGTLEPNASGAEDDE